MTSPEKTRIYYRITSERVAELWASVRAVARDHIDNIDALVADYVGERDALDEVGHEELARRLDSGGVVVIDVRPEAEYRAGHIRGARSVPIDGLPHAIGELSADVEVVAYCRGQYCVFADDAVRFLRRRRRPARRLKDGFPEWRAAGFPVASGTPT